MRCPNCQFENPGSKKFCSECGAGLLRRCPQCAADNAPAAKFCGECGAALAGKLQTDPAKPPTVASPIIRITVERTDAANALEGERKTVTALFADIKGSTELMEDLDPEEARAIIDPALKLMIDAVHRYGGYVVQSTGDGIFALFGAPAAHEDHPQRALYAALRIQDELKRHSNRVRAQGGLPIQTRIGVNTGEVVVRSIHTGAGQTEYTPIGHTTNLASRMQALAPIGSVAVTEVTRRLCEAYFMLRALGATRVKGVSEPVNVYEVTGLGPLRTRFQRAAGRGLTRFVGREAELAEMRRALEAAREGHGKIVATTGEPGVGKSRLLFEFKAVVQSDCMVLEAYSVSHGKASAYVPVVELLRKYFRIVPEDDPRQRRQKVIGKLFELDRSLEDAVPYVFGLLGIHEGDDPFAQMDAQIRRQRTQDALKRILLRESLNQPLIVVFEDLHWIDSETQALLDLLAGSIATAEILLLVNYRPEYSHQWNSKAYYTQLRLDPLSAAGAAEMLDALLGDGKDLVALKRLIVERTEGNPFFVEEIVQALFEDGALLRNGSIKLVRSMNAVKVPATVQAVLAARIDRLPPEEKELLQTLAVIGREFPAALVGKVSQRTETVLDGMLSHLQGAEFIYEQPAFPDVEYIFKHALTQEVAYNSVLVERRKLLHHQIAEAIESLFSDRLDDHLKDLAHHYRRSNNSLKAIEYLRRAGEQAAVRAFYEAAIEQLNSALELLTKLDAGRARDADELAVRAALMGPLIAIRSLTGIENLQNDERLLELCHETGNTRYLTLVLCHLFFFHRSATSLDKAATFAHYALELAEQTRGEIEIFCGNFVCGLLAAENGEYPAARQHLERGLGISQQTRDTIINDPNIALGLLNCTGLLVSVCWILGYPDQARGHAKRLVELLQKALPANAYAIGTHYLLTMRCDFLGEYQGACVHAREALERSTQSGYRWGIVFGTIALGKIMVAEGVVEDGLDQLEAGLSAAEVAWDHHWADCLAARAYIHARCVGEGSAIVEQAIARIAAGGSRLFESELHQLRGEFIVMAGALNEAEAAFNSAIAIARRQHAKAFELRASMSLAHLLARQGRREEARASLADIYNWFTEGFDTADLKQAKALLEQLS